VEEKRAWKGFWNEKLVALSRQMLKDPSILTVLLTGRSTAYIDLINRMLDSKQLRYDLVALKPKKARGVNNSTLKFKYAFIDDILKLGPSIDQVDIYEDRAYHRDAFEIYLQNWRRVKESLLVEEECGGVQIKSVELAEHRNHEEIGLKEFKVHLVEMPIIHLKEELEESLVKRMIEETNVADMQDTGEEYGLERRVFNVGYRIDDDVFARLYKTYLEMSTEQLASERGEWRKLRNPSIFIHFNSTPYVLDKVGGVGKQVGFKITHFAVSETILAIRVVPFKSYYQCTDRHGQTVSRPDARTKFWTKNRIPVLVLATRNGGRPSDANNIQDWTPVSESLEFIGEVAVKQELSIVRAPKEVTWGQEYVERPQTVSLSMNSYHPQPQY
jgi:HAD domain family 1 in Swiss Army Knife RNA repair proteins